MVPPESGGLINLYGKVFSFACARVDGIRSEPTLKGGLDKISAGLSQILEHLRKSTIGRFLVRYRRLFVEVLHI